MSEAARVLVVANKTAATPALIEAVRERAARGPATFTLLVPNAAHGLHKLVDPEDQAQARPSRRSSSRCRCSRPRPAAPVEGMIGVPEPLAAIQDAINIHGFDELIISTLPQRVSKWLKLDLPSKAAGLGLPVTTVIASSRESGRDGLALEADVPPLDLDAGDHRDLRDREPGDRNHQALNRRRAAAIRRLYDRAMFRSIVVGTDGSDTAGKAVDEAIDLAKAVGAALCLVSAYEPVPKARLREEARQTPADLQWMVNPREEVDPTLSDAADLVREAGVDVETFAREGDPADAILDVAEERGADLIIVGNKGMTGARRFLLGSVPNKVSHHAPCSVLIIRTT